VRRIATSLLAGAAVAFTTAAPGQAQLGGWSLSVSAEGGVNIPTRQLGKNASTIPQLPVLQVVADRETSAVIGGGVEFTSPSGETILRARFTTTLNGGVNGRLGVCGDPDEPLFQGPLCEPVETTAEERSFSADIGFMQGSPGDRVRASIHIGGGLRSFSFGSTDCVDPTDWELVCSFTSDIWADDGGITPFILAGLKLNGDVGPASLWVEGTDRIGRYRGGLNGADGNFQNDVAVTAGFTFRVF
jgi:hypothetical protein